MESMSELIVQNTRRQELRITLWGDTSRSFDVDSVLKLPPPVLTVVTSLRLNIYQDHVEASNSNHTCIIINPSLPQTEDFKMVFKGEEDKVKIASSPSKRLAATELRQQEKIMLSDLNALNPLNFTDKTVFCTGTILRFPTHNGWYYKACSVPGCYKQLTKIEGNDEYVCMNHGTQDYLPCYRLQMTIKDADNQATLTLMGKQAEQLFNNTCTELLNKRLYPTEETLPEEVEKTVGQHLTFEIRINMNSELVVKNIYPDPESEAMDRSPTVLTPVPSLLERKRATESSGTNLFSSELGKKFKRQSNEALSSKQEEVKKKSE